MTGTNQRTLNLDPQRRGLSITVIAVVCCAISVALGNAALADPKPCETGDDAPAQAADNGVQVLEADGIKARIVPAKNLEQAKRKRPAQDPKPKLSGPPPQWACDAPTINMEPLWAGKPIEATWSIRNDGTGDLEIKLKGG